MYNVVRMLTMDEKVIFSTILADSFHITVILENCSFSNMKTSLHTWQLVEIYAHKHIIVNRNLANTDFVINFIYLPKII